MPKMGRLFFKSDTSLLSFDETIAKIREKVADNPYGWFPAQEKDFNRAYRQKHKGELPFRLTEFKLGNPDHSYEVNKAFPAVATFMPAAISVAGYDDGRVLIYRKNTGLMGKFFGGVIRRVMTRNVPEKLDEMLEGILQ